VDALQDDLCNARLKPADQKQSPGALSGPQCFYSDRLIIYPRVVRRDPHARVIIVGRMVLPAT